MTDRKLKKMLAALDGHAQDIPPVWMMRQAGRYLPEYRKVRQQAGDFLTLCYTPDLAAEVTLQPIRRYGFDAAIIFADILLIPHALGVPLQFVQGQGPQLGTTTTGSDIDQLKPVSQIHETLSPVYETIKIVARELPQETTLIGFAGAPWTVATYMIAGHGTPDQAPARQLMREDEATFARLIEVITEATIAYLSAQITAGAEVVKLFDSWAGTLSAEQFERYAIEPASKIFSALKRMHPDIRIIGFPRGAGTKYKDFQAETACDGLALDQSVDIAWATNTLLPGRCLQGNLSPDVLLRGGDTLEKETRKIVANFSDTPFVFNLGHGVQKDTNPDHVALMVDTIRNPL